MHRSFHWVLLAVVILGWLHRNVSQAQTSPRPNAQFRMESLIFTDPTRNRTIPVVTYSQSGNAKKLAVISHGYGGKNTDYSFLANHLVAKGYFVASIQHQLPSDPPLPTTGKPYETRMPSWQNSVANIAFVTAALKREHPSLQTKQLLLLGHSHGGDACMLFAQLHPKQAGLVISFDNRRMPIPRTKHPRILSLRSSDQPADPGVLPSPEEQKRFGITIINLPATIHNDMWDGAGDQQKAEMLGHIDAFLAK